MQEEARAKWDAGGDARGSTPSPQNEISVRVPQLRHDVKVHAVDAREELGRHHDHRADGEVEEQVVGRLLLSVAEEVLL